MSVVFFLFFPPCSLLLPHTVKTTPLASSGFQIYYSFFTLQREAENYSRERNERSCDELGVIYNKVFQCKVQKRSFIIWTFFFPRDSVMMMYGRHYLPALIWRWHKQPYWILFSGSFPGGRDGRKCALPSVNSLRLDVIFRATKVWWDAGENVTGFFVAIFQEGEYNFRLLVPQQSMEKS